MYREAPEVAHTGAFWNDDDPLRMRLNAALRWDTNPITASFRRDINHEPTSPAVVDYPADTDPLQVMINVALWTHRLSTHIASATHRHGN
jgi:hypothetical protein